MLDSGQFENRAALARYLGVSRANVTPEAQERIEALVVTILQQREKAAAIEGLLRG
jgi:hypothetical protein